jgi:hypothetical protein
MHAMPWAIGEGPELLHDHARALGVERGDRLVAQDDLGVLDQGAGDADALLLSAGKLVCAAVGELSQAHLVEDLERADLLLLGVDAEGAGEGASCNRGARGGRSGWRSDGRPDCSSGRSSRSGDGPCRDGALDRWVMSSPSKTMVPSVGSIRRLMQRRNVDLPAPEGPMTETNSPGSR